jgi:hypothetical protein
MSYLGLQTAYAHRLLLPSPAPRPPHQAAQLAHRSDGPNAWPRRMTNILQGNVSGFVEARADLRCVSSNLAPIVSVEIASSLSNMPRRPLGAFLLAAERP